MSQSKQIVLPVSGAELGTFILSLLGQPRTIERYFDVHRLEVDRGWFDSLLSLLEQRLSQNVHAMASFKASIYFEDGKRIILSDPQSFLAFHDYAQVETLGVDISITYVVEFPSQQNPARQDIRVELFSDREIKDLAKPKTNASPTKRQGLVGYTIQCVDLTWGEDISRHLNSHILPAVTLENATRKTLAKTVSFIRRFAPTLGVCGLAVTLIAIPLSEYFEYSSRYKQLEEQIRIIGPKVNLETINARLVAYAEVVSKDTLHVGNVHFHVGSRDCFYVVAALSLYVLWMLLQESAKEFTFVIYNDYTDQLAKRLRRKRENITWGFLIAIIVGTVSGILATRIDSYIFG